MVAGSYRKCRISPLAKRAHFDKPRNPLAHDKTAIFW